MCRDLGFSLPYEVSRRSRAPSGRVTAIFDEMAKKMVERGQNRSGEACRTKDKSLCLAYKHICSPKTSGNNRVTHPFFKELDYILKGDPSIKTRGDEPRPAKN